VHSGLYPHNLEDRAAAAAAAAAATHAPGPLLRPRCHGRSGAVPSGSRPTAVRQGGGLPPAQHSSQGARAKEAPQPPKRTGAFCPTQRLFDR
jgi:hypothetical protein